MTRILNVGTGYGDTVNTFNVELKDGELVKCNLIDCFGKKEYYAINTGASISARGFTQEQEAERERLGAEEPVRNNDWVVIDGELFIAAVHGRPAADQVVFIKDDGQGSRYRGKFQNLGASHCASANK